MARDMRTLASYLEEAKAMILKWGEKWMLKDDQVLGQVASSIMRAENDYDPEHSSGASVVTFRITYGKREIWNVYRKKKSMNDKGLHFSIDAQHDKGSKPFSFAETLEDKSPTFLDDIVTDDELEEKKKRVRDLLDDSYLSPKQREYLTAKYVDGLSSKEIAEKFSVSKQAVSEGLSKGLNKLREIT